MVAATGPKFYPRVEPGPDPKQERKVNSAGRKTAEKRTGKLSTLEAWEGYRVFRDGRSPTGWIDLHRIPVVAIDTNGHALRMNLRKGKPEYVSPTPAGDDGGLFGSFGKILTFGGGDLFGGLLEISGNSELNAVRVEAGIAATGAIVAAGGLGASGIDELTGGGGFSSLVGVPAGASSIIPITLPPARQEPAAAQPRGSVFLPMLLAVGALAMVVILSPKKR